MTPRVPLLPDGSRRGQVFPACFGHEDCQHDQQERRHNLCLGYALRFSIPVVCPCKCHKIAAVLGSGARLEFKKPGKAKGRGR